MNRPLASVVIVYAVGLLLAQIFQPPIVVLLAVSFFILVLILILKKLRPFLLWPLLALVGCFLFYVNIGAFWTYVERIGSAAGLGLDAVSNGVAFATLTSLAGVVFASWLGVRRGYVSPIAASAVVIVLAAAMLAGRPSLVMFVAANIIYSIAWNVSMTYQYSVVNAVDESRRGVALAPSFHSAGGAAGPAVAALFVTATDHDGALWLVGGSVLASVACFVLALRLHGPAHRSAPG